MSRTLSIEKLLYKIPQVLCPRSRSSKELRNFRSLVARVRPQTEWTSCSISSLKHLSCPPLAHHCKSSKQRALAAMSLSKPLWITISQRMASKRPRYWIPKSWWPPCRWSTEANKNIEEIKSKSQSNSRLSKAKSNLSTHRTQKQFSRLLWKSTDRAWIKRMSTQILICSHSSFPSCIRNRQMMYRRSLRTLQRGYNSRSQTKMREGTEMRPKTQDTSLTWASRRSRDQTQRETVMTRAEAQKPRDLPLHRRPPRRTPT